MNSKQIEYDISVQIKNRNEQINVYERKIYTLKRKLKKVKNEYMIQIIKDEIKEFTNKIRTLTRINRSARKRIAVHDIDVPKETELVNEFKKKFVSAASRRSKSLGSLESFPVLTYIDPYTPEDPYYQIINSS